MGRFTNPRRWAAFAKRKRMPGMTESDITPDEARVALTVILLKAGAVLERVTDYDPAKDWFAVVGRRSRQPGEAYGKLLDCYVPGETVAKVVVAARILGGAKVLRRKPDIAKAG